MNRYPSGLDPLTAYEDDPVANTVHHPYSAFNQGWDARDAGYGIDRNPYGDGTREEHFWSLGWIEADEDDPRYYEDPEPPPSMVAAASLTWRKTRA